VPSVRVVTAAESAARDRAAIGAGVPSRALMRAAGMAAATSIARRLTARLAGGIAVYAGPGNNGGDAWVTAAALAAAGAVVRVAVVGDGRTDDAKAERAAAEPFLMSGAPLGTETIIVDGLLGTGATGVPHGAIAQAIATIGAARAGGATVVALDVPSGVDATTGAATGALTADLTLTFGTLKRGLAIARGACGQIVVLDIGLGLHGDGGDSAPRLVDASYVRAHIPAIPADAHKGTRRHIAVVAAGPGMVGAAILAARSAVASGIGLIKLFVSPVNVPIVQTAAYEALAHPWPADDDAVRREIDRWADAVLIGPGVGTTDDSRAVVERVLRGSRLPVVIDADGLNMFAGRSAALGDLLAARPAIITPHPAEFARLAATSIETVLAQRFDIGDTIASGLRATVLLKGVPTVVTGADGARYVSATGTPVLATGGSGDVLSGITATLLAQTGDPVASAACAAWIHGRAAEIAGGGRVRGITLDDVLAALPAVWSETPGPHEYPDLAELPPAGDSS
jgi:ADP-dependent NAD(P)H-hydrate dehydratase / NAD(P)H-hydrate epimerase